MTPVRLEPVALWSRVKHSTTEPLGFLIICLKNIILVILYVIAHKTLLFVPYYLIHPLNMQVQFPRGAAGVVDKPLALYPGVQVQPWFIQPAGRDFKPWPHLNMTLAVCGTLNKNSLTQRSLVG